MSREMQPLPDLCTLLVSVDPGLEGTGWAMWRWKKPWWSLWFHGCFTPNAAARRDPYTALGMITMSLGSLLKAVRPLSPVVVCEEPAVFQGAVGLAAAGRGDLVKLAAVYGAVQAVASLTCSDFIPAPVNLWKGQLPKALCKRRIERWVLANPTRCDFVKSGVPATSHTWDAIGIGLWALGEF